MDSDTKDFVSSEPRYTSSHKVTHGQFTACVELGADPEKLLKILDCGSQPFNNPLQRFNCENVLDMLHYTEQATQCENIGMALGEKIRPNTYGNVGYALTLSNSVRHGSQVHHKYQRLAHEFCSSDHGEISDDTFRISSRSNVGSDERLRPFIESLYCSIASILRWALWNPNLQFTIRYRHDKPANIEPYLKFFGGDVLYNQEINAMEMPIAIVDEPFNQANPDLFKIMTARLDTELNNLNTIHLAKSQVYQTIHTLIGEKPVTSPIIAEILGYSPRTLSRKLDQENTSFRAILEEVRKEHAQFYLQQGGRSLAEISLALGYSDQSAFTRAYRSWHGRAPTTTQ